MKRCGESAELAAGLKGRVGELERRVLELRKDKDLFRLSWEAAAEENPALAVARERVAAEWGQKVGEG